MPKSILYNGWVDAWGDVDHSGDPGSGRIGCMARRLTQLRKREEELCAKLHSVRQAQDIAMNALDRFIAENKSAPAPAGE